MPSTGFVVHVFGNMFFFFFFFLVKFIVRE